MQRVTCYFDHVTRRDDNKLELLTMTGKVEGKKPRNRYPKRLSDIRTTRATDQRRTPQATDRNRRRQMIGRMME